MSTTAESALLHFLRQRTLTHPSGPQRTPAYVESYPFALLFSVSTPQLQEKEFKPDFEWQEKSKAVLKTCILTDRNCLAAALAALTLDFVHKHIISRRWALEEAAYEMRALFQLTSADSVRNVFFTRPTLGDLFAAFRISFEWTRTTNGYDEIIFRAMRFNYRQTTIADLDSKFFIMHRYIGDIVWMSGPIPDSEEEDDDDEDVKVLSSSKVGVVMEKLRSPEMDAAAGKRGNISAHDK
ncbi:hypothetical protein C8R47DRAFT_1282864 [Mycena vitilis]|nr:hypothetical protein C8R47DRAFT_1282864 [Mycena vitilis]